MDKKVFLAIGIALATAIAVLVALPGGTQENLFTQKNESLGLVVNTPTQQVTIDQIKQVYARAGESGAGRTNLYMFWNHIEPEQEKYNWKDTDVLMSLNKNNDMKVTLYFSIINGRTIGPYPTWMGTPGFGTSLEQKTTRTIDAVLTRYGGAIDSVIIGAQLDSYFDDADGSVGLYLESFENIYKELKQKHPNVKIGNAFSLNNVLNKDLQNHVSEFAETGDFVAFTYLPVDRINDITKTPLEAQADLQKALDMVPNNQIAFFEISWSTASDINGSEDSQTEFIKLAYDFYRQNKPKIEFFNWYRAYDRPAGTCIIDQKFDESSQVSLTNNDQYVRERLGSYTCNAGLIKTDNSVKSGWHEIKNQIRVS
ncbi:MAG: hypothetical protein ACT4OD_06435 [Candidatus Nitrosotenuis sp.]